MAGKVAAPGHGGGKRGRLDVTADPNVIPFIDVMLVLLIIFMIAAPIATVDVTVDMPDARIDPTKRPPRPTWVSIQDDGAGQVSVFVMNDRVELENLGEKTLESVVANATINTPDIQGSPTDDAYLYALMANTPIYIRGENATKYGNVLRVMNALNARGFQKVSLVAEDRRR